MVPTFAWAVGGAATLVFALIARVDVRTALLLRPSIEVIDVSAMLAAEDGRARGARAVARAAGARSGMGMFRITGHGVDIDGVLNASRALFRLDQRDKDAAAGAGGFQRGYIPLAGESGLADFVELKEGFCYGFPWDPLATPPNAMTAPNVWPSAAARGGVAAGGVADGGVEEAVAAAATEAESVARQVSAIQSTLLGFFNQSLRISAALGRALSLGMRRPADFIDRLTDGGECWIALRWASLPCPMPCAASWCNLVPCVTSACLVQPRVASILVL